MRLLRGSGIAGLGAMARLSQRGDLLLARPLLSVPKARLIATLAKAKLGFADDPTNRDASFARPRLRALLPLLAAEGGDARALARLASRLARANAALELLVDGAERFLGLTGGAVAVPDAAEFDAAAFATLPEEVRLRLLARSVNRLGHEGPAELGKLEALLLALDRSSTDAARKRGTKSAAAGLKQTLAGAVVSQHRGRIRIVPAPPRRRKKGK
jgi:tRNA(Ile)-lysidine synthase